MPILLAVLAGLAAFAGWQALSASPVPKTSTPQPVMVQLDPNQTTQAVSAATGTPFTISLPPGAIWDAQTIGGIGYAGVVPSATGFSAWSGSAAVSTNGSVTGLYAGGGGSVMAVWMDASGGSHQSIVTFTG